MGVKEWETLQRKTFYGQEKKPHQYDAGNEYKFLPAGGSFLSVFSSAAKSRLTSSIVFCEQLENTGWQWFRATSPECRAGCGCAMPPAKPI